MTFSKVTHSVHQVHHQDVCWTCCDHPSKGSLQDMARPPCQFPGWQPEAGSTLLETQEAARSPSHTPRQLSNPKLKRPLR